MSTTPGGPGQPGFTRDGSGRVITSVRRRTGTGRLPGRC